MGRLSSVGVAARYGLDAREIESRLGGGGGLARISALVQTNPGANTASYEIGIPGDKAAGAWLYPPTHLTSRLKK